MYTLSESEVSAVQKLQRQYQDCQNSIKQAVDQANKLQGALDGMVYLMAAQQGLIVTGTERITLDPEFKSISVVAGK